MGIKTGYTKKSGRCLVSAAEKDGMTLIAVTLNAPDDWKDHSVLFDYGFSQLEAVVFDETTFQGEVPIVGGESDSIRVSGTEKEVFLPQNTVSVLNKVICLPRFLYAPVQAGDTVGSIDYYKDNQKIASIPIIADDSISYSVRKKSWFNP